jgi:WD40 repeat protein
MRDLRVTHPKDDKIRIEQDKGGLLAGVCDWIFDYPEFQRWRETAGCQSFWIRGDPGKGKTMLICSVVDELERTKRQQYQLCYFFCQATDTRINNAVAVLRGLLYMLVDQQPLLIQHIEKQHHHAGRSLFEDVNSWVVLTKLFSDILQDPQLNSTIFIIDALDECTLQLTDLLHFIASVSARSPRVKWLYSSRDWPTIEEPLSRAQQMLHLQLELNAGTIANGVRMFSEQKVHQLATEKGYSESLKNEVLQYFRDNAGDTFLWVALVCRSLHNIPRWHVRQRLHEFPPGLDALYARMMIQIEESEGNEYCKAVLATVALALRPLTLSELGFIADLAEEIICSVEDIADIVRRSGCFLTMRGDAQEDQVVSFVHQSAKDYIIEQARDTIFPAGMSKEHARLAQKCVQRMREPGALHKDVCGLRRPGTRRTDIDSEEIAKMMSARVTYTSSFWAEHFIASGQTLSDNDHVHQFLQQYFLYWFEALSWLGQAASAVLYTARLQLQVDKVSASAWTAQCVLLTEVQGHRGQQMLAFLKDAYRFVSMNRDVADLAPLQLYLSALIFTPVNSIIRKAFLQQRTDVFSTLPNVFPHWSATLQTLTGHTDSVTSVALSADGTRLASASHDRTVRLWDAATGAPLQTLEGHTDGVTSVALSADGTRLASASGDRTVRLWDAATGAPLQTLEGHTQPVTSVALSADGTRLASGSGDRTVRLWDAATGAPLQTLEGHTGPVGLVAFSADGTRLASASDDGTVRLWDAATGAPLQTLEGHTRHVKFSAEGTLLLTDFGQFAVSEDEFYYDREHVLLKPVLHTLQLQYEWIQHNGNDILWLPHDFRGTCSAVYGKTLVIGQSSGAVSLFQARDECHIVS